MPLWGTSVGSLNVASGIHKGAVVLARVWESTVAIEFPSYYSHGVNFLWFLHYAFTVYILTFTLVSFYFFNSARD